MNRPGRTLTSLGRFYDVRPVGRYRPCMDQGIIEPSEGMIVPDSATRRMVQENSG